MQAAVQQARAALENPILVGEPRMASPAAGGNENLSPNPGFDMGAVRTTLRTIHLSAAALSVSCQGSAQVALGHPHSAR